MRKLIVSLNITLDDLIAGPNGELDWHLDHWCDEMADKLTAELYKCDCILLGRKTYSGMMESWNQKRLERGFPKPDLGFFHRMDECDKLVCSNTVVKSEWMNSRIVRNVSRKDLLSLKMQTGKNIIVYGSGQLVSSLMNWNLIDEFHCWKHPVSLGKGIELEGFISKRQDFRLIDSEHFPSGVVLEKCSVGVKSSQAQWA